MVNLWAGLHKLPFDTSVAFSLVLISIYCITIKVNDSEVDDCGQKLNLPLSLLLFRST